jgi:membrane-anchored mycosin MYCP
MRHRATGLRSTNGRPRRAALTRPLALWAIPRGPLALRAALRRPLALGAAVGTLAAVAALPIAPHAALAAPAACPVAPPAAQPPPTAQPWAQRRFDPARLASFADGRDVKVAVIDSGVDADHPQMRGHVLGGGTDFIDTQGDGRQDCVGHGTAVASVIVAQPSPATPFRGLAPGASVLPIRVSEQENTQGNVSGRLPPQPEKSFATAVRYAVDHGAKVINLSVVLGNDDPEVRAATAYAIGHNVVVVAAVGNAHAQGDPTPYPAAYDGVIGVGAITPDGVRLDISQVGRYVDIVAPGSEIVVASPGRGYQSYQGTSVAAPFVAATAALVIQYHPELSAREVAARILATADPAPGPPGSKEYGYGVLNPYRALTEGVSSEPPNKPAPVPPVPADPGAAQASASATRTRTVALALTAGVGGLALLVILVANVVPRGRRRGWRPGTG